jgi:uncharacterized membrane protein YidH (DUF202 family)
MRLLGLGLYPAMLLALATEVLSFSGWLAQQRTRLANERALLTYARTSLTLVGFGLVLLHP